MANIQNGQTAGLLIGRILLGLIFVISGIGKIGKFVGVAGYMSSKGIPMSEVLLIGTIALEVLGGLAIITGWKARWAAAAIVLFLVPATLVFHQFWAADQASYQNQLNHFLKNLAIMGGMIYIVLAGPGKLSLDRGAENGAMSSAR